MSSFQLILQHTYLTELLGTPEGRAMVLNQAAVAEDMDEGRLFEILESRVCDSELGRMIRRHKNDERRHAALFETCLARTGFALSPVPSDVQLIVHLDRALGGFFGRFEAGELGVMEVYVLLQVIEERALTQFMALEPHFRVHDRESADVLVQVSADERRHLHYCRAISARYAPDEDARRVTLERYRRVEAEAFARVSLANMAYCLDTGLVGKRRSHRLAWRAARAVARWRPHLEFTPFAAHA